MKLREYQAKAVFSRHGIGIPEGKVATTPKQAAAIGKELGTSVVLKPQLSVKGRGKVGGIGFADSQDQILQEATRLLNMEIKGEGVHTLLVEEKLSIETELYVAATIDYCVGAPVLIASSQGGVDIEEVARHRPEKVIKIPVDILSGISKGDLDPVTRELGADVATLLEELYRIFRDTDAEMVEINPLIRTPDGDLIAADGVLNINPDSVFRQKDFKSLKIPGEDPLARAAREKSWTYIDLDGDIGILSSGAGLTMVILDLIQRSGGQAANFLDTAQMDDQGVQEAFALLRQAREVKVLLVNIFAGLNRCDLLAQGIVKALEDHPAPMPVVVRMVGNHEERGHDILSQAGIQPFTDLESAVDRVVTIAKEVSP